MKDLTPITVYKVTNETYRKLIDDWAESIKFPLISSAVYNSLHMSKDDMINYAFGQNIVVEIEEYAGPIKKLNLIAKLTDYKND